MPAAPAYSIFSATSELLVTAAVFYVLYRAYAKDDFRGGLLAVVLVFEAVVNITYMAYRIAVPAHGDAIPAWQSALLAGHGILSLTMFLALVLVSLVAFGLASKGENFFREQPTMTWGFVVLWSLSILSGEALFVVQYVV